MIHPHIRRNFAIPIMAGWIIAIGCWTLGASLGIESPASIFVYTTSCILGMFAVVVAVTSHLLEKSAHEPAPPVGCTDAGLGAGAAPGSTT